MKKLAAVFLLVCMSFNVFAITNVTGKIARIYPNDNRIHFSLKNDQCNTGIEVYYYFLLDSEVKKAWYSLILAAANTDKAILVSLPNCPVDRASVEIRYIVQDF